MLDLRKPNLQSTGDNKPNSQTVPKGYSGKQHSVAHDTGLGDMSVSQDLHGSPSKCSRLQVLFPLSQGLTVERTELGLMLQMGDPEAQRGKVIHTRPHSC